MSVWGVWALCVWRALGNPAADVRDAKLRARDKDVPPARVLHGQGGLHSRGGDSRGIRSNLGEHKLGLERLLRFGLGLGLGRRLGQLSIRVRLALIT